MVPNRLFASVVSAQHTEQKYIRQALILVEATHSQIGHAVEYNSNYEAITYPNGSVASLFDEAYAQTLSATQQMPLQSGSLKAGDVVSQILSGNLPHIVIIPEKKSRENISLIIHNISRGV